MQLTTNHTTPTASHPGKGAIGREYDTRPLYLQVYDRLLEKITSGELAVGHALPNEHDLAKEMRISDGTVRKALDLLESEKRLTRRQGRGTYVNDFIPEERERLAQCYCRAEQVAHSAGLGEFTVDGELVKAVADCIWLTAQELRARGAEYPDRFGNAVIRRAKTVIARKEKEAEEAAKVAAA